jgi:hypothetical protein
LNPPEKESTQGVHPSASVIPDADETYSITSVGHEGRAFCRCLRTFVLASGRKRRLLEFGCDEAQASAGRYFCSVEKKIRLRSDVYGGFRATKIGVREIGVGKEFFLNIPFNFYNRF